MVTIDQHLAEDLRGNNWLTLGGNPSIVEVDVGLCDTNDNLFGVVGDAVDRDWLLVVEFDVDEDVTVGVKVNGFNTWKLKKK